MRTQNGIKVLTHKKIVPIFEMFIAVEYQSIALWHLYVNMQKLFFHIMLASYSITAINDANDIQNETMLTCLHSQIFHMLICVEL